MTIGILYGLGACLIWGLIFIVPEFMQSFSSIEIALGRYLVYGLLSTCIFSRLYLTGRCRYPKKVWLTAIFYSLFLSIGYYTFVVLGVRFASPAICALISGLSPIVIAFYGNFKQKEIPYRSLIFPSLLILLGLFGINYPHLTQTNAKATYLIGLGCSFLALFAWSWYVVSNSRFLKSNRNVLSSDWATLLGVGTLFWDVLLFLVVILFFDSELESKKFLSWSPELQQFIGGSLVLGLLCSWVGGFLWNRASTHLPVSLSGQLMICETIFGVLFFYTLEKKLPPLSELLGMVLLILAIILSIQQFTKKKRLRKNLEALNETDLQH